MMNGRGNMAFLRIYKPLKRLPGWGEVSDHPNKFGCYPKEANDRIETTPCFNRVAMGTNPDHLTASAVFDRIISCN